MNEISKPEMKHKYSYTAHKLLLMGSIVLLAGYIVNSVTFYRRSAFTVDILSEQIYEDLDWKGANVAD